MNPFLVHIKKDPAPHDVDKFAPKDREGAQEHASQLKRMDKQVTTPPTRSLCITGGCRLKVGLDQAFGMDRRRGSGGRAGPRQPRSTQRRVGKLVGKPGVRRASNSSRLNASGVCPKKQANKHQHTHTTHWPRVCLPTPKTCWVYDLERPERSCLSEP